MKKRIMVLLATSISVMLLKSGNPQAHAEDAESLFRPFSKEVRAVLENGEKFVLLSVKPSPLEDDVPGERFHGHTILGKLEIKDPQVRRKLLTALNSAVEKGCRENLIANCFNPRHGIKAMSGTNEVDLLICFECRQIQVFRGKENILTLVTKDPSDLFDRTLHQAGVPLAQE
jgi:hypothetical protein